MKVPFKLLSIVLQAIFVLVSCSALFISTQAQEDLNSLFTDAGLLNWREMC